ncbi:alkaline phosphatase-like [Haematobia irritans]|uniref:alkaline phosphatase-like n=1 Tax=Haematobia irritans TaxID=7368 RepID=UPI003F4FC027
MKPIFIIFILVEAVWSVSLKDGDFHPLHKLTGSKDSSSTRIFENVGNGKITPEHEKDPEFWRTLARSELASRLQKYNNKKAKNVIFFLGDGMSLNTLTASRILKGQLKGNPGEEDQLSFEKFPHTALSKTYCSNAQVPDSGCTATAYLCGIKTNIITIGVSPKVQYSNCSMSMDPQYQLSSIADWAQEAGKSTGFITTTTLTHASPSGLYAKVANRFWECDADIPQQVYEQGPCMDMAQQLINRSPGRNFDIIMGGGMGKFLPNSVVDAHGQPGERLDGKNLLELWKSQNPKGTLVTNRQQLLNVNVNKVSKIMGIFHSDLMDFHMDADPVKQPTLSEMTEVALKLVKRNKKGYVLFIEGGLIDYGNHYNKAAKSLDETLELDKAVQLAMNMTSEDDTLIVVSADHSHPLTITGYPGRGTNILGLNEHDVDDNGVKYSTLNYAVGPEQYLDANGQRIDLEPIISQDPDFTYPSQIPSSQGTHAGDDVGVYARGPHSHLFRGVMQQHTIPHLMAYAACIGNGPTLCNSQI